jgi:hypothetical protein
VVVQDINATNTICMDKICDLPNYNKMVPHVRSVELYDQERYANVSAQVSTAGKHKSHVVLSSHIHRDRPALEPNLTLD